MEVSNKQMWDSEEYIFLPLVTELLSIKVSVSAVWSGIILLSTSCIGSSSAGLTEHVFAASLKSKCGHTLNSIDLFRILNGESNSETWEQVCTANINVVHSRIS